jgi:hypothetical protein
MVGQTMRHTYLPDGASGEFAPGWDVSKDRTMDVEHLAAYGLGSPFPEDSKLCAALAAYWPAAAPDAGRSFYSEYQMYPTVSPLTDQEIGQVGDLPWDGISGPKIVKFEGTSFVEYYKNVYVDYVENSLKNRFTLKLTGKVDTNKYKSRILAMARAYQASGILKTPLGENSEKIKSEWQKIKSEWPVFSFREISATHAELKEAEKQTGLKLEGELYRIEIYHIKNMRDHINDPKKVLVSMQGKMIFLVGSISDVLVKRDESTWKSVTTV